MRKALNTVILGAPGGGKGTISKKMVKAFAFQHVSTGDILRSHVRDPSSKLGQEAAGYMKSGGLVPDKLVFDMLQDHLKANPAPRVLLDGFPRTLEQAREMKNIVDLDAVVVLDIPHETIVDRISNRLVHPASGRVYNLTYNAPKVEGKDDETGEDLIQRDDDKPETVKARLEAYEKMTSPLIEYYSNDKDVNVKVFKGTESDVIFPEIQAYMETYFKEV
jgi:nucleoside-triphosphate--adenylate kinase